MTDFINPLISLIPGNENLTNKTATIAAAEFRYGDFLNKLLIFLMTASVIFFLVVQPINHLMELTRGKQPPADPTTRKCPECLSEVPIKARRCMYCTTRIDPVKKAG